MLVKVIKGFRDLNENAIRVEGDVFEVSDSRHDQLVNHELGPFVEVLEGESNLMDLTRKELVAKAEELGIEVEEKATKAQIVELIESHA